MPTKLQDCAAAKDGEAVVNSSTCSDSEVRIQQDSDPDLKDYYAIFEGWRASIGGSCG